MLDKAHEAVARGDFSTALRHLLAAWETRKVAPIGDAIDAVGRAAAARIDPPTGKTPKDRRAAWNKLARKADPALTGVLLATVVERLFADTLGRFKKLDRSDPRVDQRIADLVEAIAYNPDGHELQWKALFTALMESEDPRMLERVRGFEAKWQANREVPIYRARRLQERRDGILPVLAKRTFAKPTAKETAACAALIAAIPGRAPVAGGDDLLAAIYEHPDDDGPRTVYMDWLLERDDPRGKFIGLQLAQERDLRQEAKLLKQFETKWLGALAEKIAPKTARFERGFLAACALREPAFEIDEDPAWGTVHTLSGGVPSSDACRTAALRTLANVDRRGLERLATLGKPLAVEALDWNGPIAWIDRPEEPDYMREDGHAGLAALEKIVVLPSLRRLELRGHAWRDGDATPPSRAEILRVLRSPCAQKLEELALPSMYAHLELWLAVLEPTRIARVEFRDGSGPMWRQGWQAHFSRGAKGTFSHLRLVGSLAHYKSAAQHYTFGYEACTALDVLDKKRLDFVRVEVPREAGWTCERQLKKPLTAALRRHDRVRETTYIEV